MATTAMEARGNVCLLALVYPQGNPLERCCPEECSAWSWEDGGNRVGHCALAGEDARPRKRKPGIPPGALPSLDNRRNGG